MSMMYCHEHDRHYDSDYDYECPECEDEPDGKREEEVERVAERDIYEAELNTAPAEGHQE